MSKRGEIKTLIFDVEYQLNQLFNATVMEDIWDDVLVNVQEDKIITEKLKPEVVKRVELRLLTIDKFSKYLNSLISIYNDEGDLLL